MQEWERKYVKQKNKSKNGKLLNLLIINVSNISFYEKSLGELGPELTRVRACL